MNDLGIWYLLERNDVKMSTTESLNVVDYYVRKWTRNGDVVKVTTFNDRVMVAVVRIVKE